MHDKQAQFEGCLLGAAVGDALGLPWERLSRQRIAKRVGDKPLSYRFLYGRGMVSDDTEHAILVAQALQRCDRDVEKFQRALAWGMRAWLLGAPAGIGLATLKSCLKLWAFVPPSRYGVLSAGNGPAMRTPLIGVYFSDDVEKLIEFCDRSSATTHRDERAIIGARLVALAARAAVNSFDASRFFKEARTACNSPANPDWIEMIDRMERSLQEKLSVDQFACSIGAKDKVTGFVLQSVPVAIYAWLIHRSDIRRGLEESIRLGGDTDTVGAIVGALCGIEAHTIPEDLLRGLWEWPRGVKWMRLLATQLATNGDVLKFAWPLVWPRNFIFTSVVLYHGFRRLV